MHETRSVCQELCVLNHMLKRLAESMVGGLFEQEITDM